MLLCNGLGTNPYSWPALLDPDCGVRVISWNHRGTGGSERPVDIEHVGIDAFAEDAIAVMDDAGIDACVLMGWSMGVNTMFEVAVRYPERVTGLFAVGGVPGDTFASMLAPIFVPRPIRKPITVNAARAMKLAGQATHPDRLATARRAAHLPGALAQRLHAADARPRARAAGDQGVPEHADRLVHAPRAALLAAPAGLAAHHRRADRFLAGKFDVLASSHDMRTAADRIPGATYDEICGPPTSSRWRSRPRSTRRCSTCSTAFPSRHRLASLATCLRSTERGWPRSCSSPRCALAGCGGDSEPEAGDTPDASPTPTTSAPSPSETSTESAAPAPSARPKVIGTVARNLEVPWGIAFLPDGTALVTERDSGRVLQIGKGKVDEVGQVEESGDGEAGLLGVAVSPSYERDKRVFFYATTTEDNRVCRTTFENGKLGQLRPILTGIPKAGNHDGGRMIFGPDGWLYVSTGEAGQPELAQDMSSLGGKILRIGQDGKPADGNPDPSSPIWTSGHRNVQGLAFDDQGNLWASEFGQDTWDELNLIKRGFNYGWPEVEGKGSDSPEFTDPQVQWRTDDASPSGLAFVDGRLYLGALARRAALAGRRQRREGERRPRPFFVGKYGRMRTVVPAPDGNLWVTTSNRDGRGDPADEDDRILLVRP